MARGVDSAARHLEIDNIAYYSDRASRDFGKYGGRRR
jgi:hypothetical protein